MFRAQKLTSKVRICFLEVRNQVGNCGLICTGAEKERGSYDVLKDRKQQRSYK